MKTTFYTKAALVLLSLQICTLNMNAQGGDSTAASTEKPAKDKRPVKDMFDGNYLINNQTAVLPNAKTLEFVIQHRFGLLTSEGFDLGGLYAPSNIRIGFNYSITKNLMLGIGTTKNNMLQDLCWKYALIRQTRSGSIPLSITYFGDAAIDVRPDAFPATVDRLSYFHQLIFARKFSKSFSMQIAGSFSHFNMVDSLVKHDNIGIAAGARYKITKSLAITAEYDQNLTAQDDKVIVVKPNLSLGIEAVTSAHVFQVFVTTGQSIINQYNVLYNKNDFSKMEFCIGFNMTRLWNF
ncbi:MAG TPA: DUF5777 family beta-barrel protein [Bacteroidia bacterium]|nr:DUF5777 family beta-barrel protein [Bacteroidia bacterium]